MLDEAKRHSESGLGPLARALRALTVAGCLAAGAVMAYGIYNFPDAPIRPAAGGYAGKHGEPRTREDFEAFVRWERTLFVVFPSAFALGFASAWADRAGRRRRSS